MSARMLHSLHELKEHSDRLGMTHATWKGLLDMSALTALCEARSVTDTVADAGGAGKLCDVCHVSPVVWTICDAEGYHAL